MPAISIRTCAAFNSSKGMADCTVQLASLRYRLFAGVCSSTTFADPSRLANRSLNSVRPVLV